MSNKTFPDVVGYARVSTEQNEQLSALETQKSRLKAAGVEKIYTDVESGRSNEREAFNELLQLIDKKRVREIVVTRYDRLGRNAAFVDAALVLASKKSVVIRTIDTGVVDTDTPQGFLMSRISTSLAEMESKMLSLRVKKAFEQKWKDGKIPRGKIPWGYHRVKYVDNDRLELHPTEGDKARQFLALLRQNGYRFSKAIIESKDVPLRKTSSVKKWLCNPILRGGIGFERVKDYQYKKVIWELHEPLIRHEDWFAIQRIMEFNRNTWGASSKVQPKLLTGLAICSGCTNRLAYLPRKKETHAFALRCNTLKCDFYNKRVKASMMVEAINKALAKRAKELANRTEEEPVEVMKLRSEVDLLIKMNDPDLEEAIKKKQEKITGLLLTDSPILKERAQILGAPGFWKHAESLPDNRLREIYLEFVLKVTANPTEVVGVDLRI
tara:strand:- start:5469 stop:6785 length:1317 start_codon:yes stop_codon:yes gene_type:complete